VTAAHTQLGAYSSALQEELSARQAAVTALTAEVARQVGAHADTTEAVRWGCRV
jgi:hypothetical protein